MEDYEVKDFKLESLYKIEDKLFKINEIIDSGFRETGRNVLNIEKNIDSNFRQVQHNLEKLKDGVSQIPIELGEKTRWIREILYEIKCAIWIIIIILITLGVTEILNLIHHW